MKMSTTQEFVLRYWLEACPNDGRTFPARADIKVTDLRNRMSHVGVVEVEQNPLDFRYRLIGTWLRGFLYEDYTGRSLRELEGKGPGSGLWSILENVYQDRDPLYCAVPYVGPKADYKQASTLYLPLADDHETMNKIMLVSNFELIEGTAFPSEHDPMASRFVPPEWRDRNA